MKRRQFMRGAAAAITLGPTLGTVTACSSPGDAGGDGTLRIVAMGNPAEPLDMMTSTSPSVYIASYNIWDSLVAIVGDDIRHQLAEDITPNADGTEWTVTLRDAKFSDGTPVTADDALASLRNQAQSPQFTQFWSDLDPERSRVVDPATFVLSLKRPRADFVRGSLAMSSLVMPKGKPDPAVGSGAFHLESGTGATGFVLVPSEHYYGERPALKRVEIRAVADPNARQNALTSGQADVAVDLPSSSLKTLTGDYEAQTLAGGSAAAMSLVLNTRMAPFDDPDIRKAVRAAVDRQQLVDVALDGNGEIGNDMIGRGLPGYDDSVPQTERDVDFARRIFEEKNVTELTLTTSEITPGINGSSELVKQQLADVGVELNLENFDPTAYYTDMSVLMQKPFYITYYVNRPVEASLPFMSGPTSPYNMSGFTSPALESAMDSAQREMDPVKRQQFYDAASRELHDNGGELIWGYRKGINGIAKGVQIPSITQGMPLLADASYE